MSDRPPLQRPRTDRVIGGVCAGLATHLGIPVAWVRAGMAVGVLAGGATAMLYLFLVLTVPQEGETEPVLPLRRVFTPPAPDGESSAHSPPEADHGSTALPGRAPRRFPVAEVLLGGSLLVTGVALLLDQLGVGVRLQVVLPGLAASVGVGLTWWLITDRDHPERNLLPRVLGALALVAVGVLMFFITAREPTVLSVIGAAVAVLAGVALAIAPWLLRINRELVAERAGREREAHRAEVAAHLHDSVLQTLALIQQQSDPGSDVSRLARGQERELREWLFAGADGDAGGHHEIGPGELKRHGTALEATNQVRFEVIVVGDRIEIPAAILGAAKEAMQNAARHAGGEVTVYLETTPEAVRVEVNDRGPGFDPAHIEEGRLGVKESIIGRMERGGGTAAISPRPGGEGTSVRLEQPRLRARQQLGNGES